MGDAQGQKYQSLDSPINVGKRDKNDHGKEYPEKGCANLPPNFARCDHGSITITFLSEISPASFVSTTTKPIDALCKEAKREGWNAELLMDSDRGFLLLFHVAFLNFGKNTRARKYFAGIDIPSNNCAKITYPNIAPCF